MGWTPKRKWTMKDAKNVKLPELLKMTKEERADLAQYLQSAFMLRVKESRRKDIMPYGLQKIIDDAEIIREKYGVSIYDRIVSGVKNHKITSKWDNVPYVNNVLSGYISMMQDFFTWKTNSVAGWNRVRNKESGELFGYKYIAGSNGRRKKVPIRIMTEEERRKFWAAYHELVKRESNNIVLSDPSKPSHYKGIKDAGLAKFWQKLADTSDIENMDIEYLIETMELSMKHNKLTFPEHEFAENGDNGTDPTFAGDGLEENDAFA